MKKAVSLILALTLCMALAVPAMAASTETISSSGKTITISGVVEKLPAMVDGKEALVYRIAHEGGTLTLDGASDTVMDAVPYTEKDGVMILDSSDAMWWSGFESGSLLTAGTTELPSGRIDSEEDGIHADGMAGYIYIDADDPQLGFFFIFAETAPTPAPAAKPVVVPTAQKLTVNGTEKNTEIYNIDGSNYFKLRDMAALLNGTTSQFSVDYDGARNTIVVKTGEAYAAVGGELATGTDKSASAALSTQSVEINGEKAELTAFNIGGNNFFKLRELGTALGFDVDYDAGTATMLVTSK